MSTKKSIRKKPVRLSEAPPRPWRVCESKGGKLYIYADGEDQPIWLLRSRKNLKRSELATLHLICEAVNKFPAKLDGWYIREENT